jgi:integrase
LLKKLTAMDLQRYYNTKMKTLSAQTVLHHHRLLHKAFDMALKWGLVSRNISDAVMPPRPRRYEAQVYDIDTTIKLLALFSGTRLFIPVLLACSTGLRRGEVLGLRWKDLDTKNKRLTVNQEIVAVNREIIVKQPKTKQSRRSVSLPDSIIDELKKHEHEQKKERIAAGEYWIDKKLISTWTNGYYWHPGTFTNYYHDILTASELPYIRFHDLRHTHASLLVFLGIQPKAISDRLGHSGIGITMDTYSHLLPGSGEQIAQLLDDKIFKQIK